MIPGIIRRAVVGRHPRDVWPYPDIEGGSAAARIDGDQFDQRIEDDSLQTLPNKWLRVARPPSKANAPIRSTAGFVSTDFAAMLDSAP